MQRTFLTAFLFILLAGCSHAETEQIPVPVIFNAGYSLSVGVTTRAPIYDIDQMEPIQILRSDGTANYSSHTAPDLTGSVAADGTVTPSIPQYYDQSGVQANFLAFYPAARSIQGGIANFKITGQEDIMSGVCWYSGNAQSPVTVTFNFSHLLTQLEYEVIAESQASIDAWGTLTYIKVATATSLDLNLNSNLLTANAVPLDQNLPSSIGDNASLSLSTSVSAAGKVMILPRSEQLMLKIKTSNSDELTIPTNLWYLAPGNIHKITLTFKGNATGIPIIATLSGWPE